MIVHAFRVRASSAVGSCAAVPDSIHSDAAVAEAAVLADVALALEIQQPLWQQKPGQQQMLQPRPEPVQPRLALQGRHEVLHFAHLGLEATQLESGQIFHGAQSGHVQNGKTHHFCICPFHAKCTLPSCKTCPWIAILPHRVRSYNLDCHTGLWQNWCRVWSAANQVL